MFFLSLDVTTNLRNLRLTHSKSAVSLLPRESAGFWEGSRNPTRRVRFQFANKFRERLVLAQFRQDVNVIGGSVYDHPDSVFSANCTAEVFMNPRPHRHRHPWFAVFRRKHDVIQKIAIGGTHSEGPFRRPSSGALFFLHITPGVPLRSTPGSIPLHPPGAPILRTRGSAWRSQADPPVQRRRRDGLKPRAKRSEARGNHRLHIFKPLTRGDGERCRISAFAPSK